MIVHGPEHGIYSTNHHLIINSDKNNTITYLTYLNERYHTRGADTHGNVANFVESEQVIINN